MKDKNKYNLGISLYPEKSEQNEILDYITLTKKAGFTHIFTNILSFETREDPRLELMKKPLKFARDKGFNVIVDVDPDVFTNMNFSPTSSEFLSFLKEIGGTGVRFDLDYGGDKESIVSKKVNVEINASTLDVTTAKKFIQSGGNISNLMACHNFYPQRHTALSEEFFRKASKQFMNLGIKVSAFVSLGSRRETIGPWGVNDGMPTLEAHRELNLSYQTRWLFATGLINTVIISAQYPTKEEIHDLSKIKLGAINLVLDPLKEISTIEREIAFDNQHGLRPERGDDLSARSSNMRTKYKNHSIPKRNNERVNFLPGDVVVLNDNYGRYKGELQIIKSNNIKNDGKRNLVGSLSKEEQQLVKLENMVGSRKLYFIKNTT